MKKVLSAAPVSKRIHTLDEIRGFAVLCMVLYHTFFLMGSTFGIDAGNKLFEFFMPMQPFFAGIFIFISGISSRLSHNNTARGLRLLLIAAAITAVSVWIAPLIGFDGLQIWFGVLHLLSVSMLIFSLTRPALDRIAPHWGILICALLYAFTAEIGYGVLHFGELIFINIPEKLFSTNLLFPLGIYSDSFFSADYFPVFPHIFLFLAGTFTGVYAAAGRFPRGMYKLRVPFFSFLGRHALIIYVCHQPVIIAILTLCRAIFKF